MTDHIDPAAVPAEERWPLLELCRDVWGADAARDLATAMGVIVQ